MTTELNDLPRGEARLVMALSGRAPVVGNANLFTFGGPELRRPQRVAAFTTTGERGLALVSTLGSLSRRLFMAVNDADPATLAEVVARAEYHDARAGALGVGDTMRLAVPALKDKGWIALLFGVPAMLELLASLPGRLAIAGTEYPLMLCILLDAEEYECRRQQGVDALIARFHARRRNLVSFEERTPRGRA